MALFQEEEILSTEETIRVEVPGGPVALMEASFLNVAVHAMREEDFHAAVEAAVDGGHKWLIANHNLHSLYLWHKHYSEKEVSSFHRFYNLARWVQFDGMSMIWLARLHGYAVSAAHRIAYNMALPPLLALAERRQWTVFYLGSAQSVLSAGAEALREKFPRLRLETHHGFFDTTQNGPDNQAVLRKIAAVRPNILLVGMGMPRQEMWVEENFNALTANVVLTAGATMDYFAGALPIPPRWVGSCGLEWGFRLLNEPRRLGFRYLVEPWLLAMHLVRRQLQRTFKSRERFQSLPFDNPGAAAQRPWT